MRHAKSNRNLGQVYLSCIPVLTAILGFTVSNISYKIYLPLWVINVFLMLAASWALGANIILTDHKEKATIAAAGLLLIAPWIFYSIFAGMGSPPETYAEWVLHGFEQQVRYSFLIIGGILVTFGFAILRESLKNTAGNIYAVIGFAAINIAMVLYVLNMSYWHSFLLETFKTEQAISLNKLPEWYLPVKKLFLVISIVEVTLTYLAVAAFGASLKFAALLKKSASWIYITISLVAFTLVALYGFYDDATIATGFPFYPLMIPAIPFILPYYMGVNLLRYAGN